MTRQSPFRLLVTAAGGALAPLNIRLLRSTAPRNVWIAATDIDAAASGQWFADAFHVVPAGTDPDYVEAILDISRRDGIDAIFPWSDEEALVLSGARDRFESGGTRILAVDHDTLTILSDKHRTYQVLDAAGVELPDWTCVETDAALTREVAHFLSAGRDFVVKPARARGNRGTVVVDHARRDRRFYEGSREEHIGPNLFDPASLEPPSSTHPLIVMTRLHAPVYDVDALCQNGRLLGAVPRERINPAGVPYRGNILRRDPRLVELAAKVAAAFSLSWLYDLDVMTSEDGRPALIEVNPRPSGSVAASILGGAPVYDWLLTAAAGGSPAGEFDYRECRVVPYLDCQIVDDHR